MDAKLKHLELIQGVVNRLATASFRIKGWSVALVAALLVLLAREGSVEFANFAFAPLLIFWGLDGYFLWQEALFRALYDHVRMLEESAIDFSMDVRSLPKDGKPTWFRKTISRTLTPFYLALAVVVLIAVGFD